MGLPAQLEIASRAHVERPAPLPPLLLDDIVKRWRRNAPPVLDRLDLALRAGTCTWVGGSNGAGKTTMLRIAAGLIAADSGAATVRGVTVRERRALYQRLVSFLPAGDRGLYARLTVRRQLDFWGRISMVPRARFSVAVERAIDRFALADLADRRVDRMSMGQRQRLRLAMTFLAEPDVVLLDEPLTSLDGAGVTLLNAAIDDVLRRDGAVLWCSPERELAPARFDASWRLSDGRLVLA